MFDVLMKIRETTGDWPRRVGPSLFVHEGGQVSWLGSSSALFGYIQSKVGLVSWSKGDNMVTKDEAFCELQRTAMKFDAIELIPHHPEIPGHYYACNTPAPGDGQTLDQLLEFFQPASLIDRELIKAALLTLLWGGGGGCRPAFVITADKGRGKGKSKLAELLASVVGGALDFSQNEDISQIKTRLLIPRRAQQTSVRARQREKSAVFLGRTGGDHYVARGEWQAKLRWRRFKAKHIDLVHYSKWRLARHRHGPASRHHQTTRAQTLRNLGRRCESIHPEKP